MCTSDLLIVKKYIPSQIGIGILVSIIVAVAMENIYVIIPALSVMIPYSLAFTAIAFDERNGWEEFRLALPLSRKDVIRGRYASFALISVASLALSLVVMGIVVFAASTLMPTTEVGKMAADVSWQIVVADIVAGLGFVLIMLAVMLPLVARFGMTKAVRFIPLVVFFGSLGFILGGANFLPETIWPQIDWIATPTGTGTAAAVSLLVLVGIYLASCALSTKLYERRELP